MGVTQQALAPDERKPSDASEFKHCRLLLLNVLVATVSKCQGDALFWDRMPIHLVKQNCPC